MRRLTPWATTTAVPTVAAVRATGAGPMTPRPTRRGPSGISVPFRFCVGVGLAGGKDGLDRDAPVGHQLTAGVAEGAGEGRGPQVLPHQQGRSGVGLEGGGDGGYVLLAE